MKNTKLDNFFINLFTTLLQFLVPCFLVYVVIASLVFLVDLFEIIFLRVDNHHTSGITRVILYLFYMFLLLML